jgi:hypothetical protein
VSSFVGLVSSFAVVVGRSIHQRLQPGNLPR